MEFKKTFELESSLDTIKLFTEWVKDSQDLQYYLKNLDGTVYLIELSEEDEDTTVETDTFDAIKLIPQEIVNKAVEEFDKTVPLINLSVDYIFKAGVKFAEKEILKHIEDIIIENQGLKMNQDLSIKFGEYISKHKLDFQPALNGKFIGLDMKIYTSKELFNQFLKERNDI